MARCPGQNQKDFDRNLVIDERTRRVAAKITAFLKESGDRFQKTIVFCVDTEHAARMRQALVNENADLVARHGRYVMRITGDDAEGCAQVGNFIDPEARLPVIVTTSRLLSTGVDAQTCRLIVLDREVGSMTEFKQIVGRGTRVHEDSRKYYFTLIDFRKATNHFADPDFDGDPVQVYQPGEDDPVVPPDEEPLGPTEVGEEVVLEPETAALEIGEGDDRPRKYYVNGRPVTILAERVEYLDEHGRLVTESLRDYSKRAVRRQYASLDEFLRRWRGTERKQAVVDELAAEGLPLDALALEVDAALDPFDLVCHVAFDRPPLTRRQRAAGARKLDVFARYEGLARAVLDALLAKYEDGALLDLDDPGILRIAPFAAMGTPLQLLNAFGGKDGFVAAANRLEAALYEVA